MAEIQDGTPNAVVGIVDLLRMRQLRTRRQFAEQEITLPGGRYKGLKLARKRQPFSMLALDAMDAAPWTEITATGPSQSGKTLVFWVVLILYHLFEVGEKVIAALPDLDMANDKWTLDILPVIEQTRYRDLLPKGGRGTRGGIGTLITFGNGAALRFMSAGGDDKRRAHFESRVVVFTEVDGFEGQISTSKEASRIDQIIARTLSWGQRRIIYKECTVTVEDGHIWQCYKKGTQSRFELPCHGCRRWVLPEREDFFGWQEASDPLSAGTNSRFNCPECGVIWSPEDRVAACQAMRLVHSGQSIDPTGQIVGPAPKTNCLSMRWSAVHNLLLDEYDLGIECWEDRQAKDEENAERKQCQFVWCVPYQQAGAEITQLGENDHAQRARGWPQGIVPAAADAPCTITIGVDIGKYQCHWVAMAFLGDLSAHVLDYGFLEPDIRNQPIDVAVIECLENFRKTQINVGWPDTDGKMRYPDQVWVDRKWEKNAVMLWVTGTGDPTHYKAIRGVGFSQAAKRRYDRPRKTTATVIFLGEEYHVTFENVVDINADYWKTQLCRQLSRPTGSPGSISLYHPTKENGHAKFWRHLTAEHHERRYIAGKGMQEIWVRDRKRNHWGDASYIALAAGNFCGSDMRGESALPAPAIAPAEPEPAPELVPAGAHAEAGPSPSIGETGYYDDAFLFTDRVDDWGVISDFYM